MLKRIKDNGGIGNEQKLSNAEKKYYEEMM